MVPRRPEVRVSFSKSYPTGCARSNGPKSQNRDSGDRFLRGNQGPFGLTNQWGLVSSVVSMFSFWSGTILLPYDPCVRLVTEVFSPGLSFGSILLVLSLLFDLNFSPLQFREVPPIFCKVNKKKFRHQFILTILDPICFRPSKFCHV